MFRKGTINDIDALTKIRIEVLRSANRLSKDADMLIVQKESYEYYKECFVKDEHVVYLVYEGDKFIACGGISFYKVMPTYHNPSGKRAYIMNMYTRLEYRRKGIAIRVLDLLVKEAKRRSITQIQLEATDMGRPLYKQYGFITMNDEMELV